MEARLKFQVSIIVLYILLEEEYKIKHPCGLLLSRHSSNTNHYMCQDNGFLDFLIFFDKYSPYNIINDENTWNLELEFRIKTLVSILWSFKFYIEYL